MDLMSLITLVDILATKDEDFEYSVHRNIVTIVARKTPYVERHLKNYIHFERGRNVHAQIKITCNG